MSEVPLYACALGSLMPGPVRNRAADPSRLVKPAYLASVRVHSDGLEVSVCAHSAGSDGICQPNLSDLPLAYPYNTMDYEDFVPSKFGGLRDQICTT